jgi:hypothetical protein
VASCIDHALQGRDAVAFTNPLQGIEPGSDQFGLDKRADGWMPQLHGVWESPTNRDQNRGIRVPHRCHGAEAVQLRIEVAH